MSWVLAIDFGTSNTSAAHRIGPDRVESLPLSHTSNLMPSSVYIDGPHSMTTGDVAVNQATLDPSGYVVAPKQHVAAGSLVVRGQDVPVAATIAAVLRAVHGKALQRHNNQPPTEVVLTHPEAWSARELGVLRQAASYAGLGGNVSLISEPRAAAFYYSRQHDARIVKGSTIAVFDFGGGTLDVAVLTATDEWTFEVIRAGGDNSLGGKNLDATISRWVDERLADDEPELFAWLRSPAGLDTRRTLDDQIRHAKELLSEHPSATIRVTGNGADLTFTLTRDEFEQMIEPQITRAVQLAAAVLRDAGITRQGLQALYLTGGSSRIPYVHRRLAELGPIATLDDPKTVVAKGAAGFVSGGRATVPPGDLATEVLRPDARHSGQSVPNPAQGNPGPSTGPAAPTKRRPLVLAGAALAAVLVAGVAAFALTRGSDDPATVAADPGLSAATVDDGGLPPATSDSAYISENTDDVTSLLPTKLLTSSTACDKDSYNSQRALEVECVINSSSSIGKAMGMEPRDLQTVTAWRDDQYARSSFIRLRDDKTGDKTTVISDDGNLLVSYRIGMGDSAYFDIVDRSTGLNVTFSAETPDAGNALVSELGWPTA